MHRLISGMMFRVLREETGVESGAFVVLMRPYFKSNNKAASSESLKNQLNQWESGQRLPSRDFVKAACQVLMNDLGGDPSAIGNLVERAQQDRPQSGIHIQHLRTQFGLTRAKLAQHMYPLLATIRDQPENQLYQWESGRQLPGIDFASAASAVFKELGADETAISELMNAFRQDRLGIAESHLATEFGISIQDSEDFVYGIDNSFKNIENAQMPAACKLRVIENLFLFLQQCPESIPYDRQELLFKCFHQLRVQWVEHIEARLTIGKVLDAEDLELYYDPPMMPQLSLLPKMPVKKGQIDFRLWSDQTKETACRIFIERMKNGDEIEKAEAAFLLRNMVSIVSVEQRQDFAGVFLELVDTRGTKRDLWLAWPGLTGALKYAGPKSPQYQSVIDSGKRHPNDVIRASIDLLTRGAKVDSTARLAEITDFIFQSSNPLICNEHVLAYYLSELCVMLPRIAQGANVPLPFSLIERTLDAVIGQMGGGILDQFIPPFIQSVSPCLEAEDQRKIELRGKQTEPT